MKGNVYHIGPKDANDKNYGSLNLFDQGISLYLVYEQEGIGMHAKVCSFI